MCIRDSSLEPGVEPLQLELVHVDAGAVEVLPGPIDQLIPARDFLSGHHWGSGRSTGPQVLKLGVVEGLAALKDVELPAHQIGRDAVGDDVGQHVPGVTGLVISPVVGSGTAALGLGRESCLLYTSDA